MTVNTIIFFFFCFLLYISKYTSITLIFYFYVFIHFYVIYKAHQIEHSNILIFILYIKLFLLMEVYDNLIGWAGGREGSSPFEIN